MAVALAMQNRWTDAVALNSSILSDSPDDLEAYNRLGKALMELGRINEAKGAFLQALEVSQYNSIAQKNLERLERLTEEEVAGGIKTETSPHAFIEESGKAGVTSLQRLASPNLLLKMAPGHPVQLLALDRALEITSASGEYLGRVEPRLASRLTRLMAGGNRYESAVTSVSEQELTIIIHEVVKHPSLAGTTSFQSRAGTEKKIYGSGRVSGELVDLEPEQRSIASAKDWSDDDTEPGDDEAFSPGVHQIIDSSDEDGGF